MLKESTINRRAFIALGATAATGLGKAQSLVVKRRIKKGEGSPLSDVVKPAGEEIEAAIRTLEETTMSDEEKRAAAFPVVQHVVDLPLDDGERRRALLLVGHRRLLERPDRRLDLLAGRLDDIAQGIAFALLDAPLHHETLRLCEARRRRGSQRDERAPIDRAFLLHL